MTNTETTNIFKDQEQFMTAGNQTVGAYNEEQQKLYVELITEEYGEFIDAVQYETLDNQVKEANDMLVVIAGWLHSVIPDAHKSWEAVHENNMLKVANPPIKDASGKIQKSPEAIAGKAVMIDKLINLVLEHHD